VPDDVLFYDSGPAASGGCAATRMLTRWRTWHLERGTCACPRPSTAAGRSTSRGTPDADPPTERQVALERRSGMEKGCCSRAAPLVASGVVAASTARVRRSWTMERTSLNTSATRTAAVPFLRAAAQVRRHERSLLVVHITRVRLPSSGPSPDCTGRLPVGS
jgi:hypothetical protein